jgi:hypothetical protein
MICESTSPTWACTYENSDFFLLSPSSRFLSLSKVIFEWSKSKTTGSIFQEGVPTARFRPFGSFLEISVRNIRGIKGGQRAQYLLKRGRSRNIETVGRVVSALRWLIFDVSGLLVAGFNEGQPRRCSRSKVAMKGDVLIVGDGS